MEELRSNIVAYHVNDYERCKKYVEDSEYLILSEDTKWLGYGMYFWDNDSNADYWVKQKKRKDLKDRDIAKTKSNIYIDKMLDFTDENHRKMFHSLWEKYKELEEIDEDEVLLGIKVDKLFDYFPILRQNFFVIRVYGNYKYTPKDGLIVYDLKKAECEPITHVKTIYSVKNNEFACCRQIMEVIKNE